MVVLFLTEVFIQGLSPQPFSDATIELSQKKKKRGLNLLIEEFQIIPSVHGCCGTSMF